MGFPIVNTKDVTVKQCKHGDFAYLKNDTIIGRSLDFYGEYAEAELALASQLLRSGSKVIDVGANIGLHSVFYSKIVGNEGEVYAFEPSHLNYFFLVTNLIKYRIRFIGLTEGCSVSPFSFLLALEQ